MLALVNAEAEDVDLKNCALGGSIILSTGGSTFVSAEVWERVTGVYCISTSLSAACLWMITAKKRQYSSVVKIFGIS